MNEPQSPPLDRSELEQSSMGDVEFERELLSEFLASTDDMLASLAGAVQDSDVERVHRAAHSLKGCCWTVGARELGSECEKLELEARDGAIACAEERLTRIRELLRQVDDFVRKTWSL
jgi:HPt (histidine-containing phosphotransfer) domain-containing protein